MHLNLLSIQTLIFSVLIDIRKTLNQRSFNVKIHSIENGPSLLTTIRTARQISNASLRSYLSSINMFDLDDLDNAVIVQSNTCSKTEIIEKIQCFDDMPQERYEVLQNSTVNIQCVVRNQHGKVQWRAQNVVLGYDRSVPGLEQLSIIGDAGRGEHNLQIRNAQTNNSGEYECQVQPVLRHPLLRRKTKVVVLVPPTTPVIFYQGKRLLDNSLIINPLQNGESLYDPFLAIHCHCSAAYPDLQFIWHWNRKVITKVMKPFVKITTISRTESQILIKTEQLKTNDRIRCSVENKATKIMKRRGMALNVLSVTIDVKFFAQPGHPEIVNSSDIMVRTFNENESINVGCRVHPRGYPSPELKWYWQFNSVFRSDLIDIEYRNSNKDKIEIKPNPITEDHFADEISAQLYGYRLSRYHHAANICCAISHVILKTEITTCVMIKVRFPPTKLLISLSNSRNTTTVMSMKEFSQQTRLIKPLQNLTLIDSRTYLFTCATNIHFNKLRLVWTVSYPSESRDQVKIEEGGQVDRVVESNFRQTISYLKIKANRSMTNKSLQCMAWPLNNVVLTSDVHLGMYYAPDKPQISGYEGSQNLTEYETISLLCTSTTGNPLPDLNWYRDNVALSNREPVVSNGDMISSLLTFKVTRDDNGKSINCVAKNTATTDYGIASDSIKLHTIFPARRLSIKSDSSQFKQIMENSILILICETDSSNPPSDIQWWRIQCQFNSSNRPMKRHVPCSKSRIKESQRERLIGEYNGWKTVSRLNYRVQWNDHNNFVECESRLSVAGKILPTSIQYDRIRLNVIFRPHFQTEATHKSVFTVQEYDDLQVHLEANGNPEKIQYRWSRNAEEIHSDSYTNIDGCTMTIKNIRREWGGNYSLVATNEIGETELKLKVDVSYCPSMNGTNITDVYGKYGDNLTVACEFDSNPNSVGYVKWTVLSPLDILATLEDSGEWLQSSVELCDQKNNRQLLNNSQIDVPSKIECTIVRQYRTVSHYRVNNASSLNSDILRCSYDNNICPRTSKIFIFHIDQPPRHLNLLQFATQGVQESTPTTLTCIFSGHPVVLVQWYNCTGNNHSSLVTITGNHSSSLLGGSGHQRASQINDQIRHNLYRSEITFTYSGGMGLRKVCCQTQNDHGTSTGTILLEPISASLKPEKLSIDRVSHNWLIVRWTQSYDGGLPQTFKILYGKKGQNAFNNQSEINGTRRRTLLYHNVSGLLPDTCYLVKVGSFNQKFQTIKYTDSIEACTTADLNKRRISTAIENSTFSNSKLPKNTFNSNQRSTFFIVTVAACVFGFVIFIINILIFVICYKRKQENNRKRQRNKDLQLPNDRHVENFSKFESSLIENNLYDGSILTTSDSCGIPESRDKEEEIPMLLYPKTICPLHFTTKDQYSNPLIIQDHYLQTSISTKTGNSEENPCYGCSSIDVPLSNVILSNQYIPFPLMHSPYGTIFNGGCDHSSGNSTISGHILQSDPITPAFSTCTLIPLQTPMAADLPPAPQQNRFIKHTISGRRQSPPSPIFVRRQP